jgi:hypothetical protein
MSLTFKDFDMEPSPEQLELLYRNGFQGVLDDPVAEHALFSAAPSFYGEFPELVGAGEGKLSAPYRAVLMLEPEFGRYERQTTGDCVSHSTRNAGMIDYCVDAMFGETEYQGRFATENIYGYRGHGGQGASCSRLALYVSSDGPGGLLVRKPYSDRQGNSVDLSVYRSSIGAGWGYRGTPDWLNAIAADNKAQRVYRCESLAEARDAISAGFGLSRCGWRGYSNRRNEDGVSAVSGRWAHAMALIGFDDTPAIKAKHPKGIVLVQNSWGIWNSGPKRAEQPDGSLWVDAKTTEAEIREGGVYVIASVRGFNREATLGLTQHVAEMSAA